MLFTTSQLAKNRTGATPHQNFPLVLRVLGNADAHFKLSVITYSLNTV